MKVLDLFAGLRGWSEPFQQRGHHIFTVEIDESFENIDLYADILNVRASDIPFRPDIILASPPCQGFSVMNIGKNWHGSGCKSDCKDCVEHEPKTALAVHSVKLVKHTLSLIRQLRPKFFVIENPRAKLRKLPMMQGFENRVVTYCQYGEKRMKPTDLWGGFPPSLKLKPICYNGAPCHIAAPRGATTATQGMKSEDSAKIPRLLSLAVCKAAEKDLR